jgi:hypothetical protein
LVLLRSGDAGASDDVDRGVVGVVVDVVDVEFGGLEIGADEDDELDDEAGAEKDDDDDDDDVDDEDSLE